MRAVVQVFVPIGGQTNHREGGARAQGAANHVVHGAGVLQGHQVAVVGRQLNAQLGHSGLAVGQQTIAESGVDPGLGHHTRAALGQPHVFGVVHALGNAGAGIQAMRLQGVLDGRSALRQWGNGGCVGGHGGHGLFSAVHQYMAQPWPRAGAQGCDVCSAQAHGKLGTWQRMRLTGSMAAWPMARDRLRCGAPRW